MAGYRFNQQEAAAPNTKVAETGLWVGGRFEEPHLRRKNRGAPKVGHPFSKLERLFFRVWTVDVCARPYRDLVGEDGAVADFALPYFVDGFVGLGHREKLG